MQPVIVWKSPPLHRLFKSCSGFSERSKVRLVALRWFVVAHFIAVSSASAQEPGTVGQFSSVITWPNIAVPAHVLPTGRAPRGAAYDSGDNATPWDPSPATTHAGTHAGAT